MVKELNVVIVEDPNGSVARQLKGTSDKNYKPKTVSFDTAFDYVVESKPNIVLINAKVSKEVILSLSQKILQIYPNIAMFICTDDARDPEFILEAFRLGVKDIINSPFNVDDFNVSVDKFIQSVSVTPKQHQSSKVMSVFSNKGGVGVTTIAVNHAIALSKKYPNKKVVLCDFVFEHGDIPIFLKKNKIEYSVVDFISDINRLDPNLIERSLVKDESSGLYLLLGPGNPEDADYISSDQIKETIALLRKTFDFIVVDLSHDFTDRNITVMDDSDLIYLVMGLELPAIRNVSRSLEVFRKLRYEKNKVKLIVNRSDSKNQIEMNLVSEKLGYPITFSLPNDYKSIVKSINEGMPTALSPKNGTFAKKIYELVEKTSGLLSIVEG